MKAMGRVGCDGMRVLCIIKLHTVIFDLKGKDYLCGDLINSIGKE